MLLNHSLKTFGHKTNNSFIKFTNQVFDRNIEKYEFEKSRIGILNFDIL